MNERMTDEEFDAEFGGRETNSPHSGAMFAAREAGRARASEVAKDEVIKALADALIGLLPLCGGMVLTKREAEARTEAEAAVRKIGRLP